MKLCTGIRCVDRAPSLLPQTIESAREAGLGDRFYLFMDGSFDVPIIDEESLVIIRREERAGAWPNFFLSLAEMYLRDPHADLFLLLEDDIIFCRELDKYLQDQYDSINVASLFSSAKVEAKIAANGKGFHQMDPGWNVSSGGQAWLFSNHWLREFLKSDFVVNYRKSPPLDLDPKHYRKDGLYHTDSVVGRFCREAGCGIQYHYPSLVQHVGHQSFMYPGFAEKKEVRYSRDFPGEEVSAMTLDDQEPAEMSPGRCVILVPANGPIEPGCEKGLMQLEQRGYPVWRVPGYAAIDQARNQMATDALNAGFAETFWIDSDVEFFPDDVDRIRKHQLPISSAIYPKKGQRALASHVLPGTEKIRFGKHGGLVEILYAATGFLHVRASVYRRIQESLALPICNEAMGKTMIPFFQPSIIDHPQHGKWYLAEDFAFCQRAKQCGFKIYADTTIRLMHIGKFGYSWEEAGADPNRYADYTFNIN